MLLPLQQNNLLAPSAEKQDAWGGSWGDAWGDAWGALPLAPGFIRGQSHGTCQASATISVGSGPVWISGTAYGTSTALGIITISGLEIPEINYGGAFHPPRIDDPRRRRRRDDETLLVIGAI